MVLQFVLDDESYRYLQRWLRNEWLRIKNARRPLEIQTEQSWLDEVFQSTESRNFFRSVFRDLNVFVHLNWKLNNPHTMIIIYLTEHEKMFMRQWITAKWIPFGHRRNVSSKARDTLPHKSLVLKSFVNDVLLRTSTVDMVFWLNYTVLFLWEFVRAWSSFSTPWGIHQFWNLLHFLNASWPLAEM